MKTSSSFRIISLVPSLTETLCFFGLQSALVGCTNFCVEPKSLRHSVPAVGGTKDADVQKIVALKPTHIVVNLEENTAQLLDELRSLAKLHNFQIVETFLDHPEDNFALIRTLGDIFNFKEQAAAWCSSHREKLNLLRGQMVAKRPFTYVYLIWMNPWMAAGNQTYISRCLEIIRGVNVLQTSNQPAERYPVLANQSTQLEQAEWIFFSSEPFPFKRRHMETFYSEFGNHHQGLQVDGQALSWYGSRFSETLSELETLREKLEIR